MPADSAEQQATFNLDYCPVSSFHAHQICSFTKNEYYIAFEQPLDSEEHFIYE